MSTLDTSMVYAAIQDLESLQDSLREIQRTLAEETAGAVDDVVDHIDEMLDTTEGAAQALEHYLIKHNQEA